MVKYLFILSSMPEWAISLVILGSIGLIVLIVFLIKRKFKILDIQNPDADKPVNEKQIIEDNLNRVLIPIEEELVEKKSDSDKASDEDNVEEKNNSSEEPK